jgi:hypothetical protein
MHGSTVSIYALSLEVTRVTSRPVQDRSRRRRLVLLFAD